MTQRKFKLRVRLQWGLPEVEQYLRLKAGSYFSACRVPRVVAFMHRWKNSIKLEHIPLSYEWKCRESRNILNSVRHASRGMRQSENRSSHLTHSTFRAACGKVWIANRPLSLVYYVAIQITSKIYKGNLKGDNLQWF